MFDFPKSLCEISVALLDFFFLKKNRFTNNEEHK